MKNKNALTLRETIGLAREVQDWERYCIASFSRCGLDGLRGRISTFTIELEKHDQRPTIDKGDYFTLKVSEESCQNHYLADYYFCSNRKIIQDIYNKGLINIERKRKHSIYNAVVEAKEILINLDKKNKK